jgi:hypothetical protein
LENGTANKRTSQKGAFHEEHLAYRENPTNGHIFLSVNALMAWIERQNKADQREADRLFEEYMTKTDDELAAMRF